MKAPPRLLDDATAPVRLADDLARIARASHTYDQAQGLELLRSSLQALDAASGGGAALGSTTTGMGGAAGSSVAAAWAVKVVAVAFLGATGWLGWTEWTAGPANSRQQVADPPPIAAEAAAKPVETPRELPRAVIAEQPSPAAASGLRNDVPRLQRSAAHREIEQLEQVKALLADHPAAAYRLARRSAREFPSGVLREEREGLSLFALWQMGKHSEARDRAEEFLARYPQSPLRARIEELISPP